MKYVGSKAAVAKHLAPIIQERLTPCTSYYEPFVGGANMITAIRGQRYGSDSNRYVIALLKALRDGWNPPDISRTQYESVRRSPESFAPPLVGWCGVCCSYSGKWFGGYAGTVQTKDGERDYIDEARRNCLRQAPLLKDITFAIKDYREIDPEPGSVIYCDPPYRNTVRYASEFDSDKFWIWCEEMSRFCTVLVSEYEAPPDWREIWSASKGSSLSANGKIGGRKLSIEKLFEYGGNS